MEELHETPVRVLHDGEAEREREREREKERGRRQETKERERERERQREREYMYCLSIQSEAAADGLGEPAPTLRVLHDGGHEEDPASQLLGAVRGGRQEALRTRRRGEGLLLHLARRARRVLRQVCRG